MVEAGCPEHKLRAVSARANTTGSFVRRSELLFTILVLVFSWKLSVNPGLSSSRTRHPFNLLFELLQNVHHFEA